MSTKSSSSNAPKMIAGDTVRLHLYNTAVIVDEVVRVTKERIYLRKQFPVQWRVVEWWSGGSLTPPQPSPQARREQMTTKHVDALKKCQKILVFLRQPPCNAELDAKLEGIIKLLDEVIEHGSGKIAESRPQGVEG